MAIGYFLGTDEAGYGPNLGPLVVSASCWRMRISEEFPKFPKDSAPPSPTRKNRENSLNESPSLFDLLVEEESEVSSDPNHPLFQGASNHSPENEGVPFSIRPEEAIDKMNRRLADCCSLQGPFPVIDSKKLYHQGNLSPLERSLFLALSLLAKGRKRNPFFNDFYPVPSCFEGFPNDGRENAPPLSLTFPTLLRELTFATKNPFPAPPWEKNGDISLPISPKFPPIESFLDDVDRVGQIFQNAGIDLLGIKSRRIQPLEFNALLDQTGLKSDLLAEETLSLASRMVTPILNRIDRRFSEKEGKEPVFLLLLCDKLGGRNRYRDLLDRHFPSIQLRTILESRPLSVYRSDRNAPVLMEVRFQAKGESNLPTALASIASKYLREISMIPFNRFWTSQIPDLKPTAGYPVDAKRFRTETETLRQSLSIPDKEFWRNK